MTMYYEVGPGWQAALLVLSQLAVIMLVGAGILAFRYKHISKQVSLGAGLLVNAALFVMMQLGSRVTGDTQKLNVHLPYVLLCLITCFSLCYAVWAILHETKNRKTINSTSIKESFDNLPTGVCFFNEAGLPVLCNRAMHRFAFAVCGRDVQFVTDLMDCLAENFVPVEGTKREGRTFLFPDGRAWRLKTRDITYENGDVYTQYIALDVTDLHRNREELTEENAQLRKVQANLKRLSANVVTITREEEILNAKIRVHDEMGRCLVEARNYLREGERIPESVVRSWQRAVSMLKFNNEVADEDMLTQIRKTCETVKMDFIQRGELPGQENVAYILTCAVRECVTNAVRYAEASELYADFTETESEAAVVVTNNGKPPVKEIVEGGGLSNLRRRVERAGGVMVVRSFPKFQLTVSVPKDRRV